MKAIVTGGSGFVGSNLVKKLNEKGCTDIVIIDNYREDKMKNLLDLTFSDYIDFSDGIDEVKKHLKSHTDANVFYHVGANADVLETDAKIMMHQNFEFSKMYYQYCQENNLSFIYASTSAIYGNSKKFTIDPKNEDPHNVYAWSKWLFDQYVRANIPHSKIKVIGLRLFNVFGLREFHKGKNACIANRFVNFVQEKGFIDLFDQAIERDYIWVEDLADIFYQASIDSDVKNGIYNVGGSTPITHREIADMVVTNYIDLGIKDGKSEDYISEIAVPAELQNKLQFYTYAEDVAPFISNIAIDNKQKMNDYIRNLIIIQNP